MMLLWRFSFPVRMLLTVIAAAAPASCWGTDPVAVQPENSNLPSGLGWAAECATAKKEIRSYSACIFADNFEEKGLGKEWDEARNPNDAVLSLVAPPAGNSKTFGAKCLKVAAHLGKDTGGGLTKWFPTSKDVFVRFYTRFDANSDYIHHFVTLRANRGLRGSDRWSGFGGAGDLPDGTQRFSTALEPWGNWGKWSAPGRWNFYSYWHEMKPSPDGRYWGNGYRPEQQPDIAKDKWICCEFFLRHNTPGLADGEQAYWIDGKLCGHWKGFNWRTDEKLQANALTLESYVTDRWTKNKVNVVYFDNLVIANRYIGPQSELAE